MISKEAGATVTIEATFNQYTPFGEYAVADPNPLPTITAIDNNKITRVDAQDMVKSATGQYYYHIQTAANWPVGIYLVKINATFGSYVDVEIDRSSFKLT